MMLVQPWERLFRRNGKFGSTMMHLYRMICRQRYQLQILCGSRPRRLDELCSSNRHQDPRNSHRGRASMNHGSAQALRLHLGIHKIQSWRRIRWAKDHPTTSWWRGCRTTCGRSHARRCWIFLIVASQRIAHPSKCIDLCRLPDQRFPSLPCCNQERMLNPTLQKDILLWRIPHRTGFRSWWRWSTLPWLSQRTWRSISCSWFWVAPWNS